MLKLFCTIGISVAKYSAKIGIAGKYISIANGDNAIIDASKGNNSLVKAY